MGYKRYKGMENKTNNKVILIATFISGFCAGMVVAHATLSPAREVEQNKDRCLQLSFGVPHKEPGKAYDDCIYILNYAE